MDRQTKRGPADHPARGRGVPSCSGQSLASAHLTKFSPNSKYAVRWSSDLDADVLDHSVTVVEEPESYFTGLYDHRGHEIHSVPERGPMGFGRDE